MSSSNQLLVTFLVPSHKEGDLIRLTCETILGELKKEGLENFEIIISDCHHEGDGGIWVGEMLERKDPRIRYVRQDGCYNLGYHYAYGLRHARGEYFMMVPGDNETKEEAIGNILRARGQAELILSYTENTEVRTLSRRFLSRLYVLICNALFGLKLRYYNGLSLIKTKLLRSILPLSEGFAYSTEIIVKLVCLKKYSYIEVPMPIRPPIKGRRAAIFRLKNLVSVGQTLLRLFMKVRLKV